MEKLAHKMLAGLFEDPPTTGSPLRGGGGGGVINTLANIEILFGGNKMCPAADS